MSNILILDTLASRYGSLPSEILARASTLDITVMDVAMSYQNMRNNAANGTPQYDSDTLRNMVEANRTRTQQIRSSGG